MSAAVSIKSVENPFKIFVGNADAPKVIHCGNIEPGKTTIKSGESIMELEFTGGDESFPNYWESYGVRLINGKRHEKDKAPIEPNDPLYKGEIEFLDPKDPDGVPIFCRYIKGLSSLDYQYQVSRLNQKTKEVDEENLMIILSRGEHSIDPAKDRAYALALKTHPMNASSKIRTDRYKNTMYKEVVLMDVNKKEAKEVTGAFDAVKLVNDSATSFAKLKVFHTILSVDKDIPYSKADENELYETLVVYANQNYKEVIERVRKYKENVTTAIEYAKSHNAFDTTTNGTLKIGLTRKEVLLDGLNCKGEDMIQYLFDTCLEPKTYDAIIVINQQSQTNFK